jgi:hypothetical protein
VNGEDQGAAQSNVFFHGEDLGTRDVEWSMTWPTGKSLETAGSDRPVMWAGEPLTVTFRASAEAIKNALAWNRPLLVEIDLPMTVTLRPGKRFVRDEDGAPQGAVDTEFAEVRWAPPAEVLWTPDGLEDAQESA